MPVATTREVTRMHPRYPRDIGTGPIGTVRAGQKPAPRRPSSRRDRPDRGVPTLFKSPSIVTLSAFCRREECDVWGCQRAHHPRPSPEGGFYAEAGEV